MAADGTQMRLLARGVTNGPTWSPDGQRLAFGANGLRVVDANGGAIRRLTRLDAEAPDWSPDGRYVDFVVTNAHSADEALYVFDRRLRARCRGLVTRWPATAGHRRQESSRRCQSAHAQEAPRRRVAHRVELAAAVGGRGPMFQPMKTTAVHSHPF
jgi:WD40-like Beta Propeller Repeat